MSDVWSSNFIDQSPLFDPLKLAYSKDRLTNNNWPTIAELNQYVANHKPTIKNHNQQSIQLIEQTCKSQEFAYGYEPSIYLRGELLTRANNWHDFFNMLVWLSFPKIKAAINYWQYNLLKLRWPAQPNRTPLENKLTHLDENGVIVVSCNQPLIELLKAQRWQELFWQQRATVQTQMQFFIIGHALYEKALNPYVGMTGSAVIFEQSEAFFTLPLAQKLGEIDRLMGQCLYEQEWLAALTKLAPVPILGVPGWWPANEHYSFYENKSYFRDKRAEK